MQFALGHVHGTIARIVGVKGLGMLGVAVGWIFLLGGEYYAAAGFFYAAGVALTQLLTAEVENTDRDIELMQSLQRARVLLMYIDVQRRMEELRNPPIIIPHLSSFEDLKPCD